MNFGPNKAKNTYGSSMAKNTDMYGPSMAKNTLMPQPIIFMALQ